MNEQQTQSSQSQVDLAHWRFWPGYVALVGVVGIVGVRCLVTFTSRASWVFTPIDDIATEMSFGHVGTAVCDWLCVVVLLLALVDRVLRKKPIHGIMLGLWLVGVVVAGYHASFDADNFRIGGNWVASLALGLAVLHLARQWRNRQFLIIALVALILPLGLNAAYQYGVGYPRDIATYEKNKAEFLVQHQWTAQSIELQKYERRLYQREAAGRFGLSNVFGSVMLSLTFIAAGLTLAIRRSQPIDPLESVSQRKVVLFVGVITFLGVVGLGLSFSRGAILAGGITVLGLFFSNILCGLLLYWWIVKRHGVMAMGVHVGGIKIFYTVTWFAVLAGVISLGLIGVLARGAFGPPATIDGERSMLFRAMYGDAAKDMWIDHSIAGIGPGRFQQQFQKYKQPWPVNDTENKQAVCPEDVTDPHNIFVSYIAMLGIGGVAWLLLIAVWLLRACFQMADLTKADGEEEADEEDMAKIYELTDGRGGNLIPGANRNWFMVMSILAGGVWFGVVYVKLFPIMFALVEYAAILASGAVGFVVLAVLLSKYRLNQRWIMRGLLCSSVAILLHNQIEMAMTNAMSAPLLYVILALAAAGRSSCYGYNMDADDACIDLDGEGSKRIQKQSLFRRLILPAVVAVVLVVQGIWVMRLYIQDELFDMAINHLRRGDVNTACTFGGLASGETTDGRLTSTVLQWGHTAIQSGQHIEKFPSDYQKMLDGFIADPYKAGSHRDQLDRTESHIAYQIWMEKTQDNTQDNTQDKTQDQWKQRSLKALHRLLENTPYSLPNHMMAADLAYAMGEVKQAELWYNRTLQIETLLYLDDLERLNDDQRKRALQRTTKSPSP